MQDVAGFGANKRNIPSRTDLPQHDLTGGNIFAPDLVAAVYPDEINQSALTAGKERALYMLRNAATMNLIIDKINLLATVEIFNETGHKLPSGYPEGRRMWINLQAYDINGNLLFESGAYDSNNAHLEKADINYETGSPVLSDTDSAQVFEIKLGMTSEVAALIGEAPGESFHFVLNNYVVKDNRIPPRGFTNDNFIKIQSPVVTNGKIDALLYADNQYWNTTEYNLPAETYKVKAQLLYQTASREYIEFLRDANITNDAGDLLYTLWSNHGKSAPVVMCEQENYLGTPPQEPDILVNNVSFTRFSAAQGKTYITASIFVTDENGAGVSDALVSGTFSGPSSEAVSGITDSDGYVDLNSREVKNVRTDWCINITDVEKTGYNFLPGETWCEPITKSASLSNTVLFEKKLRIYPNPFIDKIYFEFTSEEDTKCIIEIFDVSGRNLDVVFNQSIKANQDYRIEYQTDKKIADILFYRIHLNEEIVTGKILHK